MRPSKSWWRWLRRWATQPVPTPQAGRTHVVLLDGTMSSLTPGCETNVGLIYRLLQDRDDVCVYYEPGIQWRGITRSIEVMAGVGINRQIKRAYAWLAQSYRPGDRVYFIGYSRGAYACRALAGMIGRIGLLRAEEASPTQVARAFEYYRCHAASVEGRAFAARACHAKTPIAAVAVFDTVQAIGLRWPLIWRFVPDVHVFENRVPMHNVARGFHALAAHETRVAFEPMLWDLPSYRVGDFEQRWFRGNHGDIGGQLRPNSPSRALSHVTLTWVLAALEEDGLHLPPDWRTRFVPNAGAPMSSNWRGFAALFWWRRQRVMGKGPSETFDASTGLQRTQGPAPGLSTSASTGG